MRNEDATIASFFWPEKWANLDSFQLMLQSETREAAAAQTAGSRAGAWKKL